MQGSKSTPPSSSTQQQKHKKFTYQTQYMNLSQFTNLISTLRNLNISLKQTKGIITSPDKQIISIIAENFQKKKSLYQQQNYKNKYRQDYCIFGQKNITKSQAIQRRYKKIIDLNYSTLAHVFINQYKNQLNSLGLQFHLFMIKQGSVIKVYSDRQVSPLFQSQIISMKQKLKWIIFHDRQFYKKLRHSKNIKKCLSDKFVRFILLRNQAVLLHSSAVTNSQELIALRNFYSYQALILEFQSQVSSRLVNRIYFRMLMYHCQPLLNQISENYQIESEISWKKMGIILHTKDPIFSQQPKAQLTNFLSKIVFISYFSKNPGKHIEHIRLNKPNSKCLQAMMSQTLIYTSWNTNLKIKSYQVKKVFNVLFDQLDAKSTIRISFRTGGLNMQVIQRVQQLTQKHKLFCQKPTHSLNNSEALHVKFKSFNNRGKRIQQLLAFLQQLLIGEQVVEINQSQERKQLKMKKKNKQTQKSESQIYQLEMNMNSPQDQSSDNQSLNDQIQVQKTEIIDLQNSLKQSPIQSFSSFKYPYDPPQKVTSKTTATIQTQQKQLEKESDYSQNLVIKGKRNKKMQAFLNDNYNILCKIWKLSILSIQQKNPSQNDPTYNQAQKQCKMYVIQKNQNLLNLKFTKINYLSFENLIPNKQYFLVSAIQNKVHLQCQKQSQSKIQETEIYILSHIIEVFKS